MRLGAAVAPEAASRVGVLLTASARVGDSSAVSPRRRLSLAATPFALALVACAASVPPMPAPRAPDLAHGRAASTGRAAGSKHEAQVELGRMPFAKLRDAVLDGWLVAEPSLGRELGLHEYDGKLGDYTAAGIAQRIGHLEAWRRELDLVDKDSLTPDEALDRGILLGQVELALFRLVDVAEWRVRPQFYEELFSVDSYTVRNYAPLGERAKRLVAHLEAALVQAPNIEKNLVSPMSRPVVETAVKIYAGYAEYLRGDVKTTFAKAGDAETQARFAKASEELAKVADELAKRLKEIEVPKGDGSHVLGTVRFKKLLQAQEGLAIDLGELKRQGEENLALNRAAYVDVKRKAKFTRGQAKTLLADATALMDAARKFVALNRIASIPEGATVLVKESPPYQRWNAAFLDPPGPFEEAKNAFYYITMPDPSWPKKEQDGYVMSRGTLLSTTIHEVYPGHFLQEECARRAPTRAQKMFGSYSFVEGWAHYGEQMMIEEGFGKEAPENRLGQLSDALLRNCRYVVSIGIHTEGMSLDAAERRFMDDCFQNKATAREQAVRATFDPGYFAYTLGKLQFLALRDEAKRRLGKRFDLRRFHDAVLSHGAPPVALLRERVLSELEAGSR